MKNRQIRERRSFPRRNLEYLLHVDSHKYKRKFGQIVDVSLVGLRVICDQQVKRQHTYELSLHLPLEVYGDPDLYGHDEICFTAQAIWTRPGPRKGTCLAGFQVTDYEQSYNHVALSSVINEYESFLNHLRVPV